MSGEYFSTNGTKSPFLCTARMPFMFQEIIFMLLLIMEFFVYISQVLVCHVSINLRGADIGVAEHGLDGADVGAVAQ
jgi:hypothetical protein